MIISNCNVIVKDDKIDIIKDGEVIYSLSINHSNDKIEKENLKLANRLDFEIMADQTCPGINLIQICGVYQDELVQRSFENWKLNYPNIWS